MYGLPSQNPHADKETSDNNGDMLIHKLWQIGKDSIHYMHVMNTSTLSHQNRSPEKCLIMTEKEKKRKYLEACLQQRLHFHPFFVSLDDLIGVKEEATLKYISRRLTMKGKQPPTPVCAAT